MRSKEEYIELLRSYFLSKAKAYGVVRMALFGMSKLIPVISISLTRERRIFSYVVV